MEKPISAQHNEVNVVIYETILQKDPNIFIHFKETEKKDTCFEYPGPKCLMLKSVRQRRCKKL